MSSRLVLSGVALLLACAIAPLRAQDTREPRQPSPPTSFWSWSGVSAWGDIGRLLLGNWSCSGAYADGPTIESCGALTTGSRRKRVALERHNDTSE
jgi:hypothetical protein